MAINLLLIAFIVVLCGDFVINLIAFKSRKKAFARALDEGEKKNSEIAKAFQYVIDTKFKQVLERIDDIRVTNVLSNPKSNALRCYAVTIRRGLETRLLVQPADNLQEMTALVTRELGPEWAITAAAHVDIERSKLAENMAAKVPEPPKAESFLHGMEYLRDTFAEKAEEKKAINSVITRLIKHYGLSHSGSAA